MFDFSSHIERETRDSGSKRKLRGKMTESYRKNIISCPSIMTGMSHEIRTKMNAIVAFSYILCNKEYSDEDKEQFSNQIYSACEQIISLFDNFLDSAIIDTGNSKIGPGICAPDKIFDKLLSEFRDKLKKDRHNEVILIWESQISNNISYSIDVNKLARVIRNLFQVTLINTESGYIKAGYYFRDNNLTFFIHDSGKGFHKCRELLQSYDMDQSLTKYNDIHIAVNLVLARKIIQLMRGSIWIEPNGFSGSRIYFSVPVEASNDIEDRVNKFSNTMSTF